VTASDVGTIITAVSAVVAALGGAAAAIISAMNRSTAIAAKSTIDAVHDSVQTVRIEIDGKMAEMVALARSSGFGRGVEQERIASRSDAASLVTTAAGVAAELKRSQDKN
jgi:hypothetical protein